jgi:multiple sugar transport system ATP-binding protein
LSLAIEAVSKRFGQVVAVDHLTLEAAADEFVVLLGPSGCGKSSLLRMIAGLEIPDSGRIVLSGKDITRLEPRDRDIAMVFQSYALYPHMTVEENIAYPLRVRKTPGVDSKAEVLRTARKLGLDSLLERRPRELSGGQRQRVALARAIVRRPKAFLMDEPLSNLDARLRVETRAELKHLQREIGTVTVYVTHDQAEAMTLAHRVAVMNEGRLHQYDTPANIYHRPADVFVAGFVGSPAMNLIEGEIAGGVFQHPSFQMKAGGATGRVTLGFRPEDVEISTQAAEGFSPARVYVTEDLGDTSYVVLEAGSLRITVRGAAMADQGVWFRPRQDRLHIFDAKTGRRVNVPPDIG